MKHLPVVQGQGGQSSQTDRSTSGEATPPPWVGPKGERTEWLELHLTYTCPERCVFCSEDHRMKAYKKYPVTWGRAARVIREHAGRGVRRVHLTGGEPTIHPRFVDVLRLAKKLGMRTSVGTIGTMLAREDFARRALPHLDEALFSLHGPNAETHDPLTRRNGSFDQVVKAIETCQAVDPDFHPYVNTVVTNRNVDVLTETVAFAVSLGARLIVISNLTPEGLGLDNYLDLAVPLAKLRDTLAMIPALSGDASIRFFGVPMCLLGEHRMLSNDLHWDPRVTVEWADAPGKVVFADQYTWTAGRKRVQPSPCDACAMNTVCMGVFDEYAARFSLDALAPEPRP